MYFSILDLLVLVYAAVAALAMTAVGLMFGLKNQKAKKILFYVSVALGAGLALFGLRIAFDSMVAFYIGAAVIGALLCVGAILVERLGKKKSAMFTVARVMSTAALAFGLFNTFLW